MKKSDLIWAMLDVDEDLIRLAEEEPVMKKTYTRPVRTLLIAAIVAVLLAGTVLAVWRYTRITDKMEENWNIQAETEMTEEQKDFVESRAAGIGESVTDQGITVTIDSVVCTTDTVEVLYSFELDPNIYDVDNIAECSEIPKEIWIENEAYGICNADSGGGANDPSEDGLYWMHMNYTFEGLPEGARINDGITTLHLGIGGCWIRYTDNLDGEDVEGNWIFEFLLPNADTVVAKTSDAELNFAGNINLEITNITVDDSGCSFDVASDSEDYHFAGSDTVEMVQAAMPDYTIYTVCATLADGTVVPTGGARSNRDMEREVRMYTVEWAAPIDPETVTSLVFSDGTTEIEVPLN